MHHLHNNIGQWKTKDNLNISNLMQKPLKILFSENIQQNSFLLHSNSPWVCVIKVCSNGGAIYIIGEWIAKNNLNKANLCKSLKIFFSKTTQQNS